MHKIEIHQNSEGLKLLVVDGKAVCYYIIRDNNAPCITIYDDDNEECVFLESMTDMQSFKYSNHFYTSHINNICELVEEAEVVA